MLSLFVLGKSRCETNPVSTSGESRPQVPTGASAVSVCFAPPVWMTIEKRDVLLKSVDGLG
jgi:hypothetical protein